MRRKVLKWVRRGLKIALIPLFFWILSHQINFQKTLKRILDLEAFFFGLSLLLLAAGLLIKTFRWSLFFQDSPIRFKDLFRIYLIGQFFNFFLPSSVGGDLSRIYEINRKISHKLQSVNSVLIERLAGTGVLAAVAFAASFFYPGLMKPGIRQTLWVISLAILLAVVLIFAIRLPLRWRHWALPPKNPSFWAGNFSRLMRIKKHFDDLLTPKLLFRVFYTSLLFHVSWIFCLQAAGVSLGLPIPWQDYWLFFPMIQLISMIPVSINGLGLTEGAFVYFFSLSGIENSEALSLALVFRLINILASLAGMVFYIEERLSLRKKLSGKNGMSWD